MHMLGQAYSLYMIYWEDKADDLVLETYSQGDSS